MSRVPGRAEFRPQGGEGRGILVVAIDVAQQRGQLCESHRVEAAVLLDTLLRPRLKLA